MQILRMHACVSSLAPPGRRSPSLISLLLPRAPRSVSLLLIDAEGTDADVLAQYPFGSLPPARVAFEPMHLSNEQWDSSVARLRSLGYENVAGPWQRAFSSVWHRVNSTEAFL